MQVRLGLRQEIVWRASAVLDVRSAAMPGDVILMVRSLVDVNSAHGKPHEAKVVSLCSTLARKTIGAKSAWQVVCCARDDSAGAGE